MIIARVYIARHGQTNENRTGIVQGQLDTELNAAGIAQAVCLAERFKDAGLHVIFSSDLSRAAKTAEIISRHHPGVRIRKEAALRERFCGELQGAPFPPRRDDTKAYGESAGAFRARAITWWTSTVLPYVSSVEPTRGPCSIMVVSHGGFIGVLTRTLLRSGKLKCADGVRPTKCGNTAVAMVEISADEGGSDGRWVLSKATLVGYGDVSHLDVVESLETNADELAIKD